MTWRGCGGPSDFDTVALEGAKIVGVARGLALRFEDFKVAFSRFGAEVSFEVFDEVCGNAVVFEEGVVDVEEEDGFAWGHLRERRGRGAGRQDWKRRRRNTDNHG